MPAESPGAIFLAMPTTTMRISLAILALLACAAVARADDVRPLFQGRYLARIDSLGFDAYRALGEEAQLSRREEARRWVKRGNERGERALDEYATAVGVCAYVPEAWLRFGQAHLLRGFDAEADWCAAAGLRTLRFEPNESKRAELEAELHVLTAHVQYNLGDYERAIEPLESALKLRPAQPEYRLMYARALGAVGRHADARRALVAFGLQHPAYAQAQGILGAVELAAGRFDAAREAFVLAQKHGLRGAVFENDRGRLELAVSDFAQASERFRAAIELRRDFIEARSNLAVAQRRAGDAAAAERTLLAALKLRADYAPVHFNLAEILREQAISAAPQAADTLRTRAREHYALALRYGYDPATILERRAGLASESPELIEAEQDLLELTEDPLISGRILHRLARVKRDQGETRIALQLLLLAQARDYDAPELHSDLGELYLRSGDTASARRELELALAANPDLVVTRVNLSIAWAMDGDLDAAERELAEAEKRDPKHPLVQLQRSSLATQRGG